MKAAAVAEMLTTNLIKVVIGSVYMTCYWLFQSVSSEYMQKGILGTALADVCALRVPF